MFININSVQTVVVLQYCMSITRREEIEKEINHVRRGTKIIKTILKRQKNIPTVNCATCASAYPSRVQYGLNN